MKIGVIQASSQKEKNNLLYESTLASVKKQGYEVINFGCFKDETDLFTYIDISVDICLLLASNSVDFIVTGCSSGQGMMLACNSLPNIICGFVENPQDAYLYGRINNGNAVSLPLGLNFGWAGEINLKCTLEKLFDEPFGIGYPKEDAERKMKDTLVLKQLNSLTKRNALEVFEQLDKDLINKALKRKEVVDHILKYGSNKQIINFINMKKE